MLWICKYSLFFQLINSFFMLCQITNYNTQKYNSKQIVENRDIHNNRLIASVIWRIYAVWVEGSNESEDLGDYFWRFGTSFLFNF